MHDLPLQGLLQQSNARSVSGEELETLGKKAASLYLNQGTKLNEAVVETVKHAGLSPEQVRRVVEFANQNAYLAEFRKEGSPHRVIEFAGGPADPGAVLQDLNDGGGGTVFDRGLADYSAPPRETKLASAAAEEAFEAALSRVDAPMLQANPLGELIELKDKLAAAHENQASILSGLEGMYMDLSELLYGQVKQAALSGYSLGEVLQAWEPFIKSAEYIEAVFHLIGPRLVKEGVFPNNDVMSESIGKIASARMANPEHPLVTTMVELCETLDKLASVRSTQHEIEGALNEVHHSLQSFHKAASAQASADREKTAKGPIPNVSPGAVKQVTDFFKRVSEPAGEYLGAVPGRFLFGEESRHPETLKKTIQWSIAHLPHAVGAGLALRGAQHLSALGDTGTGHAVKSFIPGTPEFQQKNQELAMNYGGFPYPMYSY